MWMVDPKIMCRQHLLGEHRELHALDGTLTKQSTWNLDGYVRHGLIETASIQARHEAIATEMLARGYRHMSPMDYVDTANRGQVDREVQLAELLRRCVRCRARHQALT